MIKKSIVPIIRMMHRNSKKEKELLGTLRISHMIPVPESEIMLYDIGYVKSALPFHQIEQLCLKFEEENQKEIP